MSFGFSCIDVLSSARFALDVYDCWHNGVLEVPYMYYRQLLSEVAIIARACERVPTSLE